MATMISGGLDIYDVLKRPLVTEKSQRLVNTGQYVFEVDERANKMQIKDAVETIFSVKVERVNVLNVPAKRTRRYRRIVVRTPGWKKAIVTLAEGERLGALEGGA